MKDKWIACRFFACLIILMLILNFQNLTNIFQINTSSSRPFFLIMIVSLYLILNLMAAIGLFFKKQWGFWIAYIAVIFTTILFSTNYIPFIHSILTLFSQNIRSILMCISNFVVLIFIAYLHVLSRKRV